MAESKPTPAEARRQAEARLAEIEEELARLRTQLANIEE